MNKPGSMNVKTLAYYLPLTLAIGVCSCAKLQRHSAEAPEAGEVKVPLEQTPPAARKTIERELAGAQLEDIARKTRNGQTIYETDIIRDGHKWEVIVAEDGKIVS